VEEEGIVKGLKENGLAEVVATGGEGCGSCGCRGACQALGGGKERRVTAINRAGATVGDQVTLTISSGSFLKASFMVYLLPIIALVIGSVMGQRYSAQIWAAAKPDTVAVLAGVFCLAVSFLGIRLYNSRLKEGQKYYPVIERVIGHLEPSPDDASPLNTQNRPPS
jgi:sigma-E factor negative regulatory protein RseC